MIYSNNMVKSVLGFFVFAGLLTSCNENNTPAVKGANNSTFYVDALTAKFTTVGEPNAQGKQNKKLITFEACLKDNAQTNSVSNLKFDVVAGEAAAAKVSDYRGCLVWYELIEFEPDAEIKNIFMTRNVVAQQSHSGTEKLVFWVNPYKDQFEFNRNGTMSAATMTSNAVSYATRDLKTQNITSTYEYDIYVKINEDVNSMLSPIRRQAEVTTLRLDYRSIDYANIEVDSKMNLTFPYVYKTSLSMDLIRQDLGNITAEKIKRGNFMFNLVFLKESSEVKNPQPSDVVAAVQWTAKPRGDVGLIEVPINVKFGNLPSLSSRMNVLLTITSLDSPALFMDQNYDGVVNSISANDNLEIALIPNESSARALFEKYTTEKAQRPVKVLTAKEVIEAEDFEVIADPSNAKFAKRMGFFGSKTVQVDVDLAKVIEDLGEAGELSVDEAKAVCTIYFQGKIKSSDDPRYKTCLANPHDNLRAEVREFVESVESKPKNITFGRLETLKITAVFGLAEEAKRRAGYDLGANIGGSLDGKLGIGTPEGLNFGGKPGSPGDPKATPPIPPTDPIKGPVTAGLGVGVSIGLNGKAYNGRTFEKMEIGKKEISISSSEEVTAQPMGVSLGVTAKKCLLISASESFKIGNRYDALPKNRYFCGKQAVKTDRTEYFFLLNNKRVENNSSVADVHSSTVSPLRMLVRGERPYDFLKGILTSEKFAYKLWVSMNADQVTDDPTNFMTQEAPLMLSATRKVLVGTEGSRKWLPVRR